MAVLFDYRCSACHGIFEYRVTVPAPPTRSCPACHQKAHRIFSPVRLGGLAQARAHPETTFAHGASAQRDDAQLPLDCVTNRDVPGLCHLSPEAAAVWVAKARGDGRALDTAYRHQESLIAQGHTLSAIAAHSGS
jgi:putative FmdB family regulatory protein